MSPHEEKLKRGVDSSRSVAVKRMPEPVLALLPNEELVVAKRKRMGRAYVINENGEKELRLFNGANELSIQDPALFEFGEQLTRESRFMAVSATNWGCGYAWSQVKPMLERLIAVGILRRADDVEADRVASSRG